MKGKVANRSLFVSTCREKGQDDYSAGHEVEITPEMKEEGAAALANFDPYFDSAEEGAIMVFRAMMVAYRPPLES
jgi:hypothetical protein